MCFNVRPTAAISGFVSPSHHLSFIGAFFYMCVVLLANKDSIQYNTIYNFTIVHDIV